MVKQVQPDFLAVFVSDFTAECPVAFRSISEVMLVKPFARDVAILSPTPFAKALVKLRVEFGKRYERLDMPVVISPAACCAVESLDQAIL